MSGFGRNTHQTGLLDLITRHNGLWMKSGLSLLIALLFGNFRHKIHTLDDHQLSLIQSYKISLPDQVTGVNCWRFIRKA